jgi:hypothetical protein
MLKAWCRLLTVEFSCDSKFVCVCVCAVFHNMEVTGHVILNLIIGSTR